MMHKNHVQISIIEFKNLAKESFISDLCMKYTFFFFWSYVLFENVYLMARINKTPIWKSET